MIKKTMGRWYNGDIRGKFWFGVQSSNDADFFGVTGTEPSYIDYFFDKDDLPKIESGIKECNERLGDYKEKLDKFFKKSETYTNEKIAKEIKTGERKAKDLLIWYARLELGKKILECVKNKGECQFEAEL